MPESFVKFSTVIPSFLKSRIIAINFKKSVLNAVRKPKEVIYLPPVTKMFQSHYVKKCAVFFVNNFLEFFL